MRERERERVFVYQDIKNVKRIMNILRSTASYDTSISYIHPSVKLDIIEPQSYIILFKE